MHIHLGNVVFALKNENYMFVGILANNETAFIKYKMS